MRSGRVQAQASHQGCGLPVSMGNGDATLFSTLAPSAQPHHLGVCSSLIDKDQSLGIKVRLTLKPDSPDSSYVFADLLAGMRSLF